MSCTPRLRYQRPSGVVATGTVSAQSDTETVPDWRDPDASCCNRACAARATLQTTCTRRDQPRRHGGLMALLLALGLVLTLGASVAIWLDRQALVGSRLDRHQRPAAARSDDSHARSPMRSSRSCSPAQRRPGVAPAFERRPARVARRPRAAHAAGQAAVTSLGTKPVQQAWRCANSQAHRQLVADIEHDRNRDVYATADADRQPGLLRQLRRSEPIKALPVGRRAARRVQIGDAGQSHGPARRPGSPGPRRDQHDPQPGAGAVAAGRDLLRARDRGRDRTSSSCARLRRRLSGRLRRAPAAVCARSLGPALADALVPDASSLEPRGRPCDLAGRHHTTADLRRSCCWSSAACC